MEFSTKHKLLKGVSFDKGPRAKKYKATIRVNGKLKHLGYFSTEHEAHAAYLKAKEQLNTLVEGE